jgi:hypothetical protein
VQDDHGTVNSQDHVLTVVTADPPRLMLGLQPGSRLTQRRRQPPGPADSPRPQRHRRRTATDTPRHSTLRRRGVERAAARERLRRRRHHEPAPTEPSHRSPRCLVTLTACTTRKRPTMMIAPDKLSGPIISTGRGLSAAYPAARMALRMAAPGQLSTGRGPRLMQGPYVLAVHQAHADATKGLEMGVPGRLTSVSGIDPREDHHRNRPRRSPHTPG